MPLVMERARIPERWAARVAHLSNDRDIPADCISVGIVNNMPDSALEGTELQFFEVLEAAAEDIPVWVRLYSLPKIPRSDSAREHLSRFYFGMDDLSNSRCDALIITGTEPRRPNLMDEPYWDALGEVLDWAQDNTVSTVLSCLAAHASVLYSDGIERHPLAQKRFGVYAHRVLGDHPLTRGIGRRLPIPHSRWNDLWEDELTSAGYTILTKSPEAGVDLFVKQTRRSLFLHFQGHPEYGALTLLREYRRDIGRFLRAERETYPLPPDGYFDPASRRTMDQFREKALAERQEGLLEAFPEGAMGEPLKNRWQEAATRIYRNWLLHIVASKADATAFERVASVGG
jgi:homoserine O-succinyltransferase